MPNTMIWAHRGASAYAPENTMPAFELAVQMGVDGFETDVHLTIDNEIVICHDDILDRVSNGTCPIYEKTLPELLKLDFSHGREGYKDTKITTLRELLTFAKDKGKIVNVEMKYSGTRWDETNELTAALAKETGMESLIIYSSFKPEPLLKLKKLVKFKVALLYGEYIDKPWEMAKQKGFDALHPHYDRIIEQDMAAKCRAEGIMLNPWTIDEPGVIKQAVSLGVDAVITNVPDIAIKIRNEIK